MRFEMYQACGEREESRDCVWKARESLGLVRLSANKSVKRVLTNCVLNESLGEVQSPRHRE